MADTLEFDLVPAGTVANAAAQVLGTESSGLLRNADSLRWQIVTSAVGGTTPSITVVLEDSLDGTNWNVLDTAPAVTAAGASAPRNVSPFLGSRLRARVSAVAGTTPSATMKVRVVAE